MFINLIRNKTPLEERVVENQRILFHAIYSGQSILLYVTGDLKYSLSFNELTDLFSSLQFYSPTFLLHGI